MSGIPDYLGLQKITTAYDTETKYPVVRKFYHVNHRMIPELEFLVEKPEYLDRVQITVASNRHAFLARNPMFGNWTGYVHAEEHRYSEIADQFHSVIHPPVTYEGHGSEFITWMTGNGIASTPVAVKLTETDFWVGFDRHRDTELEELMQMIYGFENTLHRIMNGDLTFRG